MKKIKILTIISLFLFVELVSVHASPNVNTTTSEDNAIGTESIRQPQISTLTKFERLGRAYNFSANLSFEENFARYKNQSDSLEKTITSPGYPEPYPLPTKEVYLISVDSGTGIEIIVHLLDIDATRDTLKITVESASPEGSNSAVIKSATPIILTGSIQEPFKFRALQTTSIKIEFVAPVRSDGGANANKGFVITYKPFGERIPPPTIPPDVTLPIESRDSISKILVVERIKQNSETWMQMKTLFCNATNQYLNATSQLNFELCYPFNVTFSKVVKCPQNWPNAVSCIEIYFAVQLYETHDAVSTIDPYSINRIPREPAGLNTTLLNQMWDKFGAKIFTDAGYPEYIKVDPKEQLLLWICIGVGAVLIVFIIGIAVLKAGLLNSKWVPLDEDDKKDLKNKNDIDITMYPSPDQVVPELFPSHPSVYGNEIGYNINNGRIPSVSDRRISHEVESSQMIEEGVNPAYIDDEERTHSNFRMRINGVNRDEVNT